MRIKIELQAWRNGNKRPTALHSDELFYFEQELNNAQLHHYFNSTIQSIGVRETYAEVQNGKLIYYLKLVDNLPVGQIPSIIKDVEGQMSDGWGEDLEFNGDIISFWHKDCGYKWSLIEDEEPEE